MRSALLSVAAFALLSLVSCNALLKKTVGVSDPTIITDDEVLAFADEHDMQPFDLYSKQCGIPLDRFEADHISEYYGAFVVYNNEDERLYIMTNPCRAMQIKVLKGLTYDTSVDLRRVDTSITEPLCIGENCADTFAYYFKPSKYQLSDYFKNARVVREGKDVEAPEYHIVFFWAKFAYKQSAETFEELRKIYEHTDNVKISLCNVDPNQCSYSEDVQPKSIPAKISISR